MVGRMDSMSEHRETSSSYGVVSNMTSSERQMRRYHIRSCLRVGRTRGGRSCSTQPRCQLKDGKKIRPHRVRLRRHRNQKGGSEQRAS